MNKSQKLIKNCLICNEGKISKELENTLLKLDKEITFARNKIKPYIIIAIVITICGFILNLYLLYIKINFFIAMMPTLSFFSLPLCVYKYSIFLNEDPKEE